MIGTDDAASGDGPEPSDRALILRMRAGEEHAFREFFLRFEPLALHLARRSGVQPALCREAAEEGLGRIALYLARPTSVTPERLAAYVAAAFLGPLRDSQRSESRRERLTLVAAGEIADSPEAAVASTCSEASLRASAGAYGEEASRSPAIAGLLAEVDALTTMEERRLLGYLAERVPQRLIADWTGVSHDAMRKRILRLRVRLRAGVLRYAATLPARERAEVMRALGRRGEGGGMGLEVGEAGAGRIDREGS